MTRKYNNLSIYHRSSRSVTRGYDDFGLCVGVEKWMRPSLWTYRSIEENRQENLEGSSCSLTREYDNLSIDRWSSRSVTRRYDDKEILEESSCSLTRKYNNLMRRMIISFRDSSEYNELYVVVV